MTENAPGIIGKLIKRYGWLLGVYTAVIGAFLSGLGILARYMTQKWYSSFFVDIDGRVNPFEVTYHTPVTMMGTFFIYMGIIIIIAGIAFAVIMKNKSNTTE